MRVKGVESLRFVVVLLPNALKFLSAMAADEEEAAGANDAPDRLEYPLKLNLGHVQEAVLGKERVKASARKVQVQKVHNVCFEPLRSTHPHHLRR